MDDLWVERFRQAMRPLIGQFSYEVQIAIVKEILAKADVPALPLYPREPAGQFPVWGPRKGNTW